MNIKERTKYIDDYISRLRNRINSGNQRKLKECNRKEIIKLSKNEICYILVRYYVCCKNQQIRLNNLTHEFMCFLQKYKSALCENYMLKGGLKKIDIIKECGRVK